MLVHRGGKCDCSSMMDKETFLTAALPHVPFDGWSQATIDATLADTNAEPGLVKVLFPRGPVDLAMAYHQRGDHEMVMRLKAEELGALRYRDRIAAGIRFRLEAADRELVRKGMALLALPQHAAIGAGAVWQTSSLIWEALGDSSRDLNWYTKRATLSAVYSSTLLFWLGDDSPGSTATWDFLDRRIDNVMSFEKVKGRARETGLVKAFMRGPERLLDQIKAPDSPRPGYPGQVQGGNRE